jgi:integral membrane protein (TIGR01906 family)
MKFLQIIVWITIPFFLIILFASLLTTKPYLMISKGLYESHERVYFDHDYAIERIMGYLNYRYDDLEFGVDENDDSVIMRDTEISHMVDVKNLYTGLRVAALVSLLLGGGLSLYIYKIDKEAFYRTIKYLPVGPLFFVMFVGGFIIIDFDTTFTIFHEIFFTNDDWLLLYTDVLIILLPGAFWMVSGLIILVLFSLSMIGIYAINEKIIKKRTT